MILFKSRTNKAKSPYRESEKKSRTGYWCSSKKKPKNNRILKSLNATAVLKHSTAVVERTKVSCEVPA